MDPVVCAAALAVQYGGTDQWVPKPFSVEVNPGEVLLLAGPSGCGKSSLSLVLNGVIPHSVPSVYQGSLTVFGREVADASAAHLASHVALVLQDPDVQILTTRVWDEVCYALENLNLPQDEIDTRAAEALLALGIAHLAQENPWHLSGGQRQRLILAATMAMRPRLLVLDEPTANLDPATAASFYTLLPRIIGEGTAVVIVEHDPDPLIEHVTRVVAFTQEGAILASGTPHEVFAAHADALQEQGIRLPSALRLARRLAPAGHVDEASAPPLSLSDGARLLASHFATPSENEERQAPVQVRGEGGAGCLVHEEEPEKPAKPENAEKAETPEAPEKPENAEKAETPQKPEEAEEPVLVVDHLTVERGRGRQRRTIINDLSFCAAPGEVVAVAGMNGCGKTTLLRALAGVQPWSAGQVSVGGKRRHPRRPSAAVTLVPQNPEHQFLEGTVASELGRGLRIAGWDRCAIEETVRRLLEEFSLAEHAQSNPFTLSGGQKRRLTVASALAEERTVICLDEPTFGQDRRHAQRLMEAMREAAQRGAAILVATHDMVLISEYADKVVLLSAKRPPHVGPTRDVLADGALLEEYGLLPTPVSRMCAAARALTPSAPSWVSWAEVGKQ